MPRSLLLICLCTVIGLTNCRKKGCTDPKATNYDADAKKDDGSCTYNEINEYSGSGSISQGEGNVTNSNLFPPGTQAASIGTVTSTDGSSWTVPADNNFENISFPWASDLYNTYIAGHDYPDAASAETALDPNDIVTVDAGGDVYTVYLAADNYFEVYVDGTPVGKDPVPYTDMNSGIVQFRAFPPFNIAVMVVDWEENLGIGTEQEGSDSHHPDKGGFIAVVKDQNDSIIAVTDNTWKAQTYYTAPVMDLSCVSESGGSRLSANCSTANSNDGSSYYGIHWSIPSGWMNNTFDDSGWPSASSFADSDVPMDNAFAVSKFADVFDNPSADASYVWSSNLTLDNLVLMRKTIP